MSKVKGLSIVQVIAMFNHYINLTRLNKPIGIYLLLWPTLIALFIAHQGFPPVELIIIFSLGAILMRSAGCAINDFADRNIDDKVARTSQRPLATKAILPKQALYCAMFLVLCASMLLFFLPYTVSLWALVAVILTSLYPFSKRFTCFPQIFLALSFSIAIPMAYAAANVPLNHSTLLLFLSTFLWTIVYDTYYAMADREEDLQAGIQSIAIKLGKSDLNFIASLQLIVLVLFLLLGLRLQLSYYFLAALFIVALIMLYQQYITRNREAKACLRAFCISHYVTGAVLVALLVKYSPFTKN